MWCALESSRCCLVFTELSLVKQGLLQCQQHHTELLSVESWLSAIWGLTNDPRLLSICISLCHQAKNNAFFFNTKHSCDIHIVVRSFAGFMDIALLLILYNKNVFKEFVTF